MRWSNEKVLIAQKFKEGEAMCEPMGMIYTFGDMDPDGIFQKIC